MANDLGFLLSTLDYTSSTKGTAGPSPELWKSVVASLKDSTGEQQVGTFFGDNFENYDSLVATNVGHGNTGFKTFEDTSTSILQVPAADGGVLRHLIDTTNHNATAMGSSGDVGTLGSMFNVTAGSEKMVAFEARIKTSQIAANTQNLFVGFTDPGLAVNDGLFTDSNIAVTNKNYIGFGTLSGTSTLLKLMYGSSGGGLGTPVSVATWVAATYVKVGLLYNPKMPASKKVTIFLDGAPISTYLTTTTLALSTFPSGVRMNMSMHAKGTGTAFNFDCDWMYGYVQR